MSLGYNLQDKSFSFFCYVLISLILNKSHLQQSPMKERGNIRLIGVTMLVSIIIIIGIGTAPISLRPPLAAQANVSMETLSRYSGPRASMAVSGNNNIYLTWWDNKTGNWQVFSRASNDSGKTFGDAVILKGIGSSPVKSLKAPPSNTTSV